MAELDIYHSRPIAPTRRIALGARNLPTDPAPGAGGVLLAGIVAEHAQHVAGDLRATVVSIVDMLERDGRVHQPAARHRFQADQVGLTKSTQQIVADDGLLEFRFDSENAAPLQLVLGALYAAASIPAVSKGAVFGALRSALVWNRPVDNQFISTIMEGRSNGMADLFAWNDPAGWALDILGIDSDAAQPSKRTVQRQFRSKLRSAHPDHGGLDEDAAALIADLTKARDILLAS